MTGNRHEFAAIEKIAKEYGAKFRFDAALFGRRDGDRSPLALRVPPEEAVAREFENAETAAGWREYLERLGPGGDTARLYCCGAGITGFHVNPWGGLQACLMVPRPEYSLVGGHFAEGWRALLSIFGAAGFRRILPAAAAIRRMCADIAPVSFWRNPAMKRGAPNYLCAIGRCRRRYSTVAAGRSGTIPPTKGQEL